MSETKNVLAVIIDKSNLAAVEAETLILEFEPFYEKSKQLIEESQSIEVLDSGDEEGIKRARAARLSLKESRVEIEKKRKELKESSLRRGKAIDGLARALREYIEPEEKRLEDLEKIAEREEAKRKDALEMERRTTLAPYGSDLTHYNLRDMSDEAFDQLEESSRLAKEKRALDIERAAKEKADREKAEAERHALAKIERDRLVAEVEKKDAELRNAQALQKLADRTVRLVQEAAEKKQREEAAEAQRIEREAAAEKRRIALAPDREKIMKFAADLRAVEIPKCEDSAATVAVEYVRGRLEKIVGGLDGTAESMEEGDS